VWQARDGVWRAKILVCNHSFLFRDISAYLKYFHMVKQGCRDGVKVVSCMNASLIHK
jgi:hypothetical protein